MYYNLGLKFEKIAADNPEAICLKYLDEHHFTYRELDNRSNQLAKWMLTQGVQKGDVIGILNNKSFMGFSLMLACLKTGIIYTNLDPFSPLSRLVKITDRCSPVLIFSDFAKDQLADEIVQAFDEKMRWLNGEAVMNGVGKEDTHLPVETEAICGTDAAYIMFTSGSTGFPKGAVMTHANILSFLQWSISITKPEAGDVFTNVNPIYFDNSVFDFYTSIFSGVALAPLTHEVTKSPRDLVNAVDKLACTIWFSVPSLLVYLLTTRMLNKECMKHFRLFVFGGEGFPKPKLKELYDLYGHRARLLNVYGPTECTCICSEYFIGPKDFEDMTHLAPLGKMTKNFFYQIVDADMNPTHKGELLLGGPNVGSGYYNDLDRTAAAFIQNPLQSNYRDIMYRTGDLVERDDKGLVHFKGRADNQIKHMGYRIELEEIESAINTISGVKEAAVIYKKQAAGLGQIVGFVATDLPLEGKELVSKVRSIVPDYMVPKKIEVRTELPKNQNGKIDRNSLKG